MTGFDPGFTIRAKVVGPQGQYVKHIQSETGTRVQIKGRGSNFIEHSTGRESDEDLHIHITWVIGKAVTTKQFAQSFLSKPTADHLYLPS